MRTLLLAALAFVAAPAIAQGGDATVMLQPGHPDLMTDGLTFDSHTLAVRISEPSVQDLGLITHEITRDGDTVTMNVDANVPQARNVGETSITFDASTLAPISRQRTTSNSSGSTTYDGAHVTGAYGRGDWDPLPFDITLDAPAFAPETIPIVARALPMRAGYTATAMTFSDDRRLRETTLTIIGEEEFTRADGSMAMAWVVEAETAGRGGGTQRHFVDATTRELIATTFSPQEGTTVVTEPTTEEAIAALEAANAASVQLRPGGDGLAVDALADYSQDYVIKVVQPVQQDAGTQSRSLMIDREAGTVTITTETEIAMAGQEQTETVVAAYPSLMPISSVSDNNGTVVDLTYSDTGVTGTRDPDEDGDGTIDLTFDEPVFDSSLLFEAVRLLPFEEGYKGSFQTFSTREGPTTVMLTVTGQEEIDGVTTWVVDAKPDEGPSTTFYVADGTRELKRIMIQPQVGVVVHFEPVTGE